MAGLVNKKVRDDLFGILPEETSDNTLTEIASAADLESSKMMDTDPTGAQEEISCDAPNTSTQILDSSSQTEAPIYSNISARRDSAPQVRNSNPCQRWGQRGHRQNKGCGHGSWNSHHKNSHPKNQPQNMLSEVERNFLGVKNRIGSQNVCESNQAMGSSTPKR